MEKDRILVRWIKYPHEKAIHKMEIHRNMCILVLIQGEKLIDHTDHGIQILKIIFLFLIGSKNVLINIWGDISYLF